MALVGEIKKGGRYTKKAQEETKIEVYHLHFEQNKPAVKIAELLNVNRNTVNEDIHYWHQQLAGEFKAQDLSAKMTKQIQRMEIQRDRLLDDLEAKKKLSPYGYKVDIVHSNEQGLAKVEEYDLIIVD